jgi:hypothetical protein
MTYPIPALISSDVSSGNCMSAVDVTTLLSSCELLFRLWKPVCGPMPNWQTRHVPKKKGEVKSCLTIKNNAVRVLKS